MYLSDSQKEWWRATYQEPSPCPAIGQTSFEIKHQDTIRLSRWREMAHTASADLTLKSSRPPHATAQSICSVMLQAASSCFILLYDPTHSEQQKFRHSLKVRSKRRPGSPTFDDTIAYSDPFALTLKSTYYILFRTPHLQHSSSRASSTLLQLGCFTSCT